MTELEFAVIALAILGAIAAAATPISVWLVDRARRRRPPIDWSPDWNVTVGDDDFEDTLSNERMRRHYYARQVTQ